MIKSHQAVPQPHKALAWDSGSIFFSPLQPLQNWVFAIYPFPLLDFAVGPVSTQEEVSILWYTGLLRALLLSSYFPLFVEDLLTSSKAIYTLTPGM